MAKIKSGYSKNILVHGYCWILSTEGKYVILTMPQITRPDGTKYYTRGELALVNKDEVSNIKEELI